MASKSPEATTDKTPLQQSNEAHAATSETPVQFTIKVLNHVTLPLHKLGDKPSYLKITGTIYKGKKVVGKTTEENSKQAPELVHVFNYETNRPEQMIVNTVLATELREAYPSDGYVGKSFQFVKHAIQGGKNYATFDIAEIEVSQ